MATPYDQILKLINDQNPVQPPFSLSTVKFTDLQVNTDGNGNTRITVVPLRGSGLVGTVEVYYNRIDFQQLDDVVWLFSDTQFDTAMTIDLLNTFRNCIYLLESDIVPLTFPTQRVGDITVMPLTAQPTSIDWIGETSLSLFVGFPVINSFLDQLVNKKFASTNYLS